MNKEKFGGDIPANYPDEVKQSKASGKVKIVFNQNRTHELHLKSRMISFPPFGEDEITVEELASAEFASQSQYFTVKG